MRGSIYQRELKTGKRVYDVVYSVRQAGKRKQVWKRGFATKKAAEGFLNQRVAESDRGEHHVVGTATVGDLLTRWLDHMEGLIAVGDSTRKPSTVFRYRQLVKDHVRPGIGSLPLRDVTGEELVAFYAKLAKTKTRGDRGKAEGNLSAATIRQIHAVCSAAFEFGVDMQMLRYNPAASAKKYAPRVQRGISLPEKVWTKQEVEAFLSAVQGRRHEPLWRLALGSGMRRGELAGLRWSRIDLDAKQLTVDASRTRAGTQIVTTTPKSGRARKIALSDATVEALREWKRQQRSELMRLGYRQPKGEDWVFTSEIGEPLHPDAISTMFRRAQKAAGVRPITFHDIRHTHLTHLAASGVPAKLLQARAGHHSAAFTMDTYVAPLEADDRVAADAIEGSLGV